MNPQQIFKFISAGDADAVRTLLDANRDAVYVRNQDEENFDEMTPLHSAAKYGQLAIVKLLVERGAEVYSNPVATYPPVVVAAWHKHPPVVDYFLSEIPDKARGTNGLGVTIHLAARQSWTGIVRKHLEIDPLSVHQRGLIGDTPLHWPAHNGFVEIVEMLLDAGADVEADEIGWIGGKPIHWACEHKPATTKLLIERGAKVNSRNVLPTSSCFGRTPLHHNAAQRDDCGEATELLLAAGAEIDAADNDGKTALQIAEKKGHQRVAAVLRAHSAG
jgi:ankyrin repeat protein